MRVVMINQNEATKSLSDQSSESNSNLLDKVIRIKLGEVELPDIDFVEYQPGLRKNVMIHLLFDNTKDDPAGSDAAIIRYLPGAFVPRHLHMGYEMVLVLQGEYV